MFVMGALSGFGERDMFYIPGAAFVGVFTERKGLHCWGCLGFMGLGVGVIVYAGAGAEACRVCNAEDLKKRDPI